MYSQPNEPFFQQKSEIEKTYSNKDLKHRTSWRLLFHFFPICWRRCQSWAYKRSSTSGDIAEFLRLEHEQTAPRTISSIHHPTRGSSSSWHPVPPPSAYGTDSRRVCRALWTECRSCNACGEDAAVMNSSSGVSSRVSAGRQQWSTTTHRPKPPTSTWSPCSPAGMTTWSVRRRTTERRQCLPTPTALTTISSAPTIHHPQCFVDDVVLAPATVSMCRSGLRTVSDHPARTTSRARTGTSTATTYPICQHSNRQHLQTSTRRGPRLSDLTSCRQSAVRITLRVLRRRQWSTSGSSAAGTTSSARSRRSRCVVRIGRTTSPTQSSTCSDRPRPCRCDSRNEFPTSTSPCAICSARPSRTELGGRRYARTITASTTCSARLQWCICRCTYHRHRPHCDRTSTYCHRRPYCDLVHHRDSSRDLKPPSTTPTIICSAR